MLLFAEHAPLPSSPVQDHKVPETQGAAWNLGM